MSHSITKIRNKCQTRVTTKNCTLLRLAILNLARDVCGGRSSRAHRARSQCVRQARGCRAWYTSARRRGPGHCRRGRASRRAHPPCLPSPGERAQAPTIARASDFYICTVVTLKFNFRLSGLRPRGLPFRLAAAGIFVRQPTSYTNQKSFFINLKRPFVSQIFEMFKIKLFLNLSGFWYNIPECKCKTKKSNLFLYLSLYLSPYI